MTRNTKNHMDYYNDNAILEEEEEDHHSIQERITPNDNHSESSLKQTLPESLKNLLQFDESLYDLMRHKTSFKHYFGREFSEKEMEETEMHKYQCFNQFFFAKECLHQKSVLEIHHAQSPEKNQLLHFLVAELLRDQAFSRGQSKAIAPEILLFDNSQQMEYSKIKIMIQQKLLQLQPSFSQSQQLESLIDTISNECLKKLHVIESRSQLEFTVNIRSLKHLLSRNKAIRIVIIDSVNAFFIDNENTTALVNGQKQLDESVLEPSTFGLQASANKKKRKNNSTGQSVKMLLAKQYDTLTQEYLEESFRKYSRVSFILTKRDYYKVRNLIEFQDNSHIIFKASEELASILSRDDIDILSPTYKTSKDYDLTNIYCMSLDNFSPQALDKAIELIRQDPLVTQLKYINPQKVSVVVKKNHISPNLSYDPNDQDSILNQEERLKLKEYPYLMNFYTFENNHFQPLSDNTYYFS